MGRLSTSRTPWIIPVSSIIVVSTLVLILYLSPLFQANEGFNIQWSIRAYHADGTLYAQRDFHNLITDQGKRNILQLIGGGQVRGSSDPWRAIAIGNSTTPPTSNDVDLNNELARVEANDRRIIPDGGTTLRLVADFLPGVGTGVITEAGIVKWISPGISKPSDLQTRQTFAPIVKGPQDTLEVIVVVNG